MLHEPIKNRVRPGGVINLCSSSCNTFTVTKANEHTGLDQHWEYGRDETTGKRPLFPSPSSWPYKFWSDYFIPLFQNPHCKWFSVIQSALLSIASSGGMWIVDNTERKVIKFIVYLVKFFFSIDIICRSRHLRVCFIYKSKRFSNRKVYRQGDQTYIRETKFESPGTR